MTAPTAAVISDQLEGRIPRLEITNQADGELAFNARANEVGVTKPAIHMLNGRVEHAAGCRPRDVEVGLHGRGRAADLVARHLSVPRVFEQLVEDGLDLVALVLAPWAGLLGEPAEHEPLEPVA